MVERLKARLETWLNAKRLAGAKAEVQANMVAVRKVVFIVVISLLEFCVEDLLRFCL